MRCSDNSKPGTSWSSGPRDRRCRHRRRRGLGHRRRCGGGHGEAVNQRLGGVGQTSTEGEHAPSRPSGDQPSGPAGPPRWLCARLSSPRRLQVRSLAPPVGPRDHVATEKPHESSPVGAEGRSITRPGPARSQPAGMTLLRARRPVGATCGHLAACRHLVGAEPRVRRRLQPRGNAGLRQRGNVGRRLPFCRRRTPPCLRRDRQFAGRPSTGCHLAEPTCAVGTA